MRNLIGRKRSDPRDDALYIFQELHIENNDNIRYNDNVIIES
ncbi:hypothetical protein HMP0721_2004 [Pseudoramibacter alactolyticus ATCC 23263]|uniref:Uncharacterized protein n=1 Tax=Pseudoramibacter alactolyticus ATCC 23263 TaxID=887929 RepID=E6MJ19_9FIRM|nr:hypothetical protein HMP0721_2004 [Pseudoramibacter alactolyticus ATCC 23263]